MYRLKQLTILLGDLVSLYIGLFLATTVRYLRLPNTNTITALISPLTALFLIAVILAFIFGLYDISRTKNNWLFFQKIIFCAVLWTIAGMMYFYILPHNSINPKTILALTTIFSFGIMTIWRFFYNRFISTALWKIKILFVGFSAETKQICDLIASAPQMGYEITGIVDENASITTTPIFKSIASVKTFPDLIVLDYKFERDAQIHKELYQKIFQQVSIIELADFYEMIYKRIPPFTFSESWFLTKFQEQSKKIYDRFRLIFDFIFALIMGIFFAITFPLIGMAIKLTSRGPILFKQQRVGRGGKIFNIYKYRTMQALAADGSAETRGAQYAELHDKRITAVGHFLRLTRLDEIPQFINILKNEMGLIGPRPERPEFVAQLTEKMPFYTLRHLIKPGLSGWAQLQNNYYAGIDENLRKLEYDLYYIKNRELLFDVAIILKTVSVVLGMKGR